MNDRSIYKLVPLKNLLKTCTLVGNKWVYTIKRDGRHRARLVALGYTQIPGVDFSKKISLVVHNITFQTTLVLAIIFKLKILILDVEVAFLHGELYKDIYMVLPTGYNLLLKNKQYIQKLGYKGPSHQAKLHFCAKLGRDLYGLVQAARQWWKKFIMELI